MLESTIGTLRFGDVVEALGPDGHWFDGSLVFSFGRAGKFHRIGLRRLGTAAACPEIIIVDLKDVQRRLGPRVDLEIPMGARHALIGTSNRETDEVGTSKPRLTLDQAQGATSAPRLVGSSGR